MRDMGRCLRWMKVDVLLWLRNRQRPPFEGRCFLVLLGLAAGRLFDRYAARRFAGLPFDNGVRVGLRDALAFGKGYPVAGVGWSSLLVVHSVSPWLSGLGRLEIGEPDQQGLAELGGSEDGEGDFGFEDQEFLVSGDEIFSCAGIGEVQELLVGGVLAAGSPWVWMVGPSLGVLFVGG